MCAVVGLCLLVTACTAPTPEDTERLRLVKERYGAKFTFWLEGEAYLSAKAKTDQTFSEADIEDIYRLFHSTGVGSDTMRTTAYVYLNVYGPDGSFLFQLYWDPISGRFDRGSTPHH